jgi:SAM-dependent methyltransferase
MSSKDQIRKMVSETYTAAVKSPTPSPCCGGPVSQADLANLAGYTVAELSALPKDAVVNSFGCGNPLAFSEVQPGEVVLDLGSGAGIDLLIASRKVGPTGRVIGVDMTDEMIERARANAAAAGLDNVEVRKGIIEELPVEDASVDWVISNCVINLSPEKEKVFAEIARVLKPGGRILISDIVVEDLPDWVRQSAELYGACVAGAIGEDEYLGGLRNAGLADVEVSERLVYDEAQLATLVEAELVPQEGAACCGGGGTGLDGEKLSRVATEVAGKVWSAKVRGRKPVPESVPGT